MKIKFILAFCCIITFTAVEAQDVTYAQSIIDTLCTEYYHGRGYVHHGDRKASEFIANQFKEIGVKPAYNDGYFHFFKLDVNTFPSDVIISKNGVNLSPGDDFIVSPNCPSTSFSHGKAVFVSETALNNKKEFKALKKTTWESQNEQEKQNILVLDTLPKDKKIEKCLSKVTKNYAYPFEMHVERKLTWSVSQNQSNSCLVQLRPGVIEAGDEISVDIKAKLEKNYRARNVVGIIDGTEEPDSFIFVTGHYDHLGRMGSEAYMPGANDNASGIGMILDLARYYQQHPPRYTMVFVAFAAEEAGLVGSYHFVKELSTLVNPSRIRFVINMDLMGSGQEGIMAVNGAVFEKEYNLLYNLNTEKKHLLVTKKRGKAANSDHYFFSESGIPAFFFYLMGPYHHYHDVEDTAENMRLEEKYYNGAFLLIKDFANALMGG